MDPARYPLTYGYLQWEAAFYGGLGPYTRRGVDLPHPEPDMGPETNPQHLVLVRRAYQFPSLTLAPARVRVFYTA